MLWLLTLLGAAAGWFVAGVPGLVLGALLGHVFDRRWQFSWRGVFGRLFKTPPLQGDELLFVLLGRLAKSGGRVTEAHIQAARAEMQRRYMDAARRRMAIQAFGRGKTGQDNLQAALQALQGELDETKSLLQSCWRLARAQGEPTEAICRLIIQWGRWAGWTEEAILQMDQGRRTSSHSSQSVPPMRKDAYREALQLLGIQADSDPQHIKLAYRRLLSHYHPDKLVGVGANTEQLRAATERTRELHSAYALVRQVRGFR